MRNHGFNQFLAPAVSAVLETMFFSEPMESSDRDPSEKQLEARVCFAGEETGALAVRISEASARSLAASFLGESEESLTASQITLVVCELANMLCGWIVSKMDCPGYFTLGSPVIVRPSTELSSEIAEFEQSFAVEGGTLSVSLYSSVPA